MFDVGDIASRLKYWQDEYRVLSSGACRELHAIISECEQEEQRRALRTQETEQADAPVTKKKSKKKAKKKV